MEVISKEVFLTVCAKVKVCGREELEIQISTKETTKMTENGVMENLHGSQEMFTKVIIKLTQETAMGK